MSTRTVDFSGVAGKSFEKKNSAAAAPTLEQGVQALHRQVEQAYGVLLDKRQTLTQLGQQSAQLGQDAQELALADAVLDNLLETVNAENLRSIEQTITYGLQTVFDDHPLSFRFQVEQGKAGTQVTPLLMYQGVEAPIVGSFGGGPAMVVSFLLRLLVCYRFQLYPLILLDESFAMVSDEYLPNLAKLLRELAAKLGYTFVLVTQQREFAAHADRAYAVRESSNGTTFEAV